MKGDCNFDHTTSRVYVTYISHLSLHMKGDCNETGPAQAAAASICARRSRGSGYLRAEEAPGQRGQASPGPILPRAARPALKRRTISSRSASAASAISVGPNG